MAGPNEIGNAKIKVEADVSGVKASLQDAKSDLNEVGNEAKATGAKIDGAFTGAGEKIEGATAGVRKFTGAISGSVGAITSMIGVFGLLSGALLAAKALFDKLTEDGGGLSKSSKMLEDMADGVTGVSRAMQESPVFAKLSEDAEALSDELIGMRASLESLKDTASNNAGPGAGQGYLATLDAIERITERIKQKEIEVSAVYDQRAQLLREINKARRDEEAKESKRIADQKNALLALKAVGDTLSFNLLQPDEQVEEQAKRQIAMIERLAEASGNRIFADAAIAAAEELKRRQLDDLREVAAEQSKLDAERIAKNTEKQIEGAKKAAEAFASEINGAFGANSDFTMRMDTIVSKLTKLADNSGMGGI